jgi:hypothetical protein
MRNFLLFFLLSNIGLAATEVNQIKREFDGLRDLSRAESFKKLKLAKYNCVEYIENSSEDGYIKYQTKLTFKADPYSIYGTGPANYLEFSEYLRDHDRMLTPRWGCEGADFGINYLDDAPYLHVDHMVSRLGNTNLGPCYTFHVRLSANGLVGIGEYDHKVIHAMKCSQFP